ncbi:Vacuolar-sorting protein SNF8 [Tritrichomonas foetus]|uniref:Vacuolar-sorting protein SNF8 n=1 Tax=Tritrichomonas foetus TaxID=1144522 RepID=A0A1J4J1Y9_9EUKA|nr:Vacuolar-sorting protein SNF8 [Tritrichomonas foetus]|eukprot:OHS93512.1 Vacuolar-sorting protein SNF8 [Tritrichomonas foetus]
MSAGLAGIQSRLALEEAKKQEGIKLRKKLIQDAQNQTKEFEESLKQFATKNGKKIKEDPEFRAAFNEMCLHIGVDPLQSRKGFWQKILKVGNFYHELAIKTIEVTLRFKRKNNGGMILLQTLIDEVSKTYAVKTKISADDIRMAIKGLDSIGQGYSISTINNKKYFVIDFQLDDDRQAVLELADKNGIFSDNDVSKLGWDKDRWNRAIDTLYKQGFIWRDELHPDKVVRYYVFSMFEGFT